jgi:hypothetical protein
MVDPARKCSFFFFDGNTDPDRVKQEVFLDKVVIVIVIVSRFAPSLFSTSFDVLHSL